MVRGDGPERRIAQRGDDGHVFRRGIVGIGWVALVSALLTVIGALIALLVSLGY